MNVSSLLQKWNMNDAHPRMTAPQRLGKPSPRVAAVVKAPAFLPLGAFFEGSMIDENPVPLFSNHFYRGFFPPLPVKPAAVKIVKMYLEIKVSWCYNK
jgi:hypothetical protein